MKLKSSLGIVFISLVLAFTSFHAEAKRLGGGSSMGRQSQNVTRQQSLPSNNYAPAKPSVAPQPQPAPSPMPAPAPARSPWGGMLGGIATGLGISWLAHSLFGGMGGFGMGSGGGSGILTLLVIGFALWMAWNFLKRRSMSTSQEIMPAYPNGHYSPYNIGNDSAARPFEYTAAPTPVAPLVIENTASSLSGSQTWGIPADFDTAGFLTAAKAHFINLQAAWDKADIAKLSSMMTTEMMTEIRAQIAERDAASPAGTVHHTEVVSIEANLMGIEEVTATSQYMASVEFSGVIREELGLAPTPFREVWNLTKPLAGGGWLVAGIQALG